MKILLLALLIFKAATPYQILTKGSIPWDAARKLTWKDFKGAPEKHVDLVAMTYSTILYKLAGSQDSITIETLASFDPKTSWTKDDTSAYLLNHEQMHFNITEIFVRKLRKALTETTFTLKNYPTKVTQLYKQTVNEWNQYQKQYDEETDNSIIKDAQAKWNVRVAAELEELSAYDTAKMTMPLH